MIFANSTYLFAMLGFLIPIAIHLWNKKEAKVIKVGSIQFVPTQDSNQSKSIQLNELFLLLLRCLILGIVSFLMAGMIIKEDQALKSVVLLDPDIIEDDRVQQALDSMGERYEIRLMVDKLPVYDPEEQVVEEPRSPWILANDLNKLNTDSIIIFTNQSLDKTKGKRPVINKTVSVISIDPLETNNYLGEAYEFNVECIMFYGSADGCSTTYTKKVTGDLPEQIEVMNNEVKLKDQSDWVTVNQLDTLKVVLVYDDEYIKDKTILNAQILGISEFTGFPIKVVAQKDKQITYDPDWLIWLSEGAMAETKSKSISFQMDEFKPLLYSGIEGSYYLSARLNYDNVLANDLSNRLLELFYELSVDNNDQRVISSSQLSMVKNTATKMLEAKSSVGSQYWLWLLLFIVLLFERFVSMKKAL